MSTIREWLSLPKAEPAEDYGFFGPDSVTWKVWSYPTSLSIGFQRSVVIEELDPALVAAVDTTHQSAPIVRLRAAGMIVDSGQLAPSAASKTVRVTDAARPRSLTDPSPSRLAVQAPTFSSTAQIWTTPCNGPRAFLPRLTELSRFGLLADTGNGKEMKLWKPPVSGVSITFVSALIQC